MSFRNKCSEDVQICNVNVTLEANVLDELDDIAAYRHWSRSRAVNIAIGCFLKREAERKAQAQKWLEDHQAKYVFGDENQEERPIVN